MGVALEWHSNKWFFFFFIFLRFFYSYFSKLHWFCLFVSFYYQMVESRQRVPKTKSKSDRQQQQHPGPGPLRQSCHQPAPSATQWRVGVLADEAYIARWPAQWLCSHEVCLDDCGAWGQQRCQGPTSTDCNLIGLRWDPSSWTFW